jgi:hypothetical protein
MTTTTVSCTLLRAMTLKVEGKGSMTSLSSYALSWPGTSATPPALCMTSCMPFMKWPATTSLVEHAVGAGNVSLVPTANAVSYASYFCFMTAFRSMLMPR